MALHHVDTLAHARSPDEATAAWESLFDPTGPLSMAVRRTKHAGLASETIRAALTSAMAALAA
jgi:hypothetical protein